MELIEFHWIQQPPPAGEQQNPNVTWKAENQEYDATYTFNPATNENKLEVKPKNPMTRQSSMEGVREEMKPGTFAPSVLHQWSCDPSTDIATRLQTIDREAMSAMHYIKGLDTPTDPK